MSIFRQNRRTRLKRNAFDLSHDKKLSMKFGDIIPIYHQEVVPGDTFQVNTEAMIRFAPMIAPVMQRIDAYVHYFFVPNRIIWDDWEKFITGDDSVSLPMTSITSVDENELLDYLGVVPGTYANGATKMNPLPYYGYNKIWNDYYRDENLQTEVLLSQTDILRRNWEKDYFTSALPWAQKGDPVAVDIDVSYVNPARSGAVGDLVADAGRDIQAGGVDTTIENIDTASFEINALRNANRLQRWLEKNAIGGSRYVEHLLHHFGVISPDARLQRPEYLGGGKQNVMISEVLQTSRTDTGETPQGTMAGHGISVGNTNQFNKFFTEHGFIFGLLSVMPRATYMSQYERHWIREDITDYYFPEFANLGEQEVLKMELHGDAVGKSDTFGYQSRYADYKYKPSTVHGDFRKTGLNFWHMGRDFGKTFGLNESFITCNPTDRIFAVQDGTDYLWTQVYNRVKAIRPMPYHVTPKL